MKLIQTKIKYNNKIVKITPQMQMNYFKEYCQQLLTEEKEPF